MRLLPLLPCILPLSLAAQHCGYDFASIIVVRPHTEGDTAVIDGLRITLLDSTNMPATNYGHAIHLFRPNSDFEACDHWQGGFGVGHQVCFPFAKDNYVLVIPSGYDTGKMKVLVQDERPRSSAKIRQRKWPKRFMQQIVPLSAFDEYLLCGVYDCVVYPDLHDRPAYHPVEIILHMR